VILAGFSNGNIFMASALARNMSKAKGSSDFRFVTESVAEVYCFDPRPAPTGNQVIDAVLGWKKIASDEAVIRFYSQNFLSPGFDRLLPNARSSGLKPGKAFFGESAKKNVTLVYVPRRDDGRDVWVRACMRLFPSDCTSSQVSEEDVHHWIPAIF